MTERTTALLQLLLHLIVLLACLAACCGADGSPNNPPAVAKAISSGSSQLRAHETWKISLPPGSQPEGIAAGSDNDLWVACLSGNIIHVDLSTNTSTIVYKEHGVHLSGTKFCKKQQLLFVSGTLSGKAYLYHMTRAAGLLGPVYTVSKREVLTLGLPGKAYINDVALSDDRAYFTDSFNAHLHWTPRFFSPSSSSSSSSPSNSSSSNSLQQQQQQHLFGSLGPLDNSRPVGRIKTGPFFDTKAGQFRANGLAVYRSNERRDTLLVANTHTGNLYKVVVDKLQGTTGSGAGSSSAAVSTAAATPTAAAASVDVAAAPAASRLRLGRLSSSTDAAAVAAAAATSDAAGRINSERKGNAAGASSSKSSSQGKSQAGKQKLFAAPVEVTEPLLDLNDLSRAAAAAAASKAAAQQQQQRLLGRYRRSLLAAAQTGAFAAAWPFGMMAQGVADKLGLWWPQQKAQMAAAVEELQLPGAAGRFTQRLLVDGIAIKDDRAFVADNFNNRVWGLSLGQGLSDARLTCVLQGPVMHVPTTLAFQAGQLWWVNAHLDTCFPFLPCPTHRFELHGVLPGQCQSLK